MFIGIQISHLKIFDTLKPTKSIELQGKISNSVNYSGFMLFQIYRKCLKIDCVLMQPSTNQYGSVDSGNVMNGQIPAFERSVTPILTDFMDPNVCYLPNTYPSTAYYYGGKLICELTE